MRIHLSSALAALALCFGASSSLAATISTNFTSQLTITADCQVSATTLDFGSSGVILAAINASSNISVQCTSGQGYKISLNAGSGSSGTIATRTMELGGNNAVSFVNYTIATDAGQTSNWGNTIGTDTVAGLGNGAAQNYPVYGRVPLQTTPVAGSYSDIVTVTVTYP